MDILWSDVVKLVFVMYIFVIVNKWSDLDGGDLCELVNF